MHTQKNQREADAGINAVENQRQRMNARWRSQLRFSLNVERQ